MSAPNATEKPPPPPLWRQRLETVQTFVVENYLPLAFAVALTFALAWPVPGRFLVRIVVAGNVHIIQEVNMAIVFFISGLVLNTTELKKALTKRDSWPSVAYGGVMIQFVTPALGFAMRHIPLTPPAFAVGLTIFCLVPTTLGIGIALVRSCKGNEAIALLLTVATNMLGVLVMPPYLRLLFLNFESGISLNVSIPDLLLKLSLTILVPSVIGKALRELWKPAEEFAKTYRTALSIASTSNLAFIVWQTLSGARDLLFEQRASMIVSVIVLSAAIHVFYLILNHFVVKYAFNPPLREGVAVVVMASQKSAPVAVTVISYVTSDPAQQGLLAIPAIVGQLSQIFIGAALAKVVAPAVVRDTKAREAAAKEAKAAKEEAAAAAAAAAGPGPDAPPDAVALTLRDDTWSSGASGGAAAPLPGAAPPPGPAAAAAPGAGAGGVDGGGAKVVRRESPAAVDEAAGPSLPGSSSNSTPHVTRDQGT